MPSSFYQRVLPSVGPYALFSGAQGPDGKLVEQRHYNGLQTIEDLERKVQELSLLPINIFFAVGSYGAPNRREPLSKRSFYLDLDSKTFGSVEEALRQLSNFVRATGLPSPSLYVHSGRGVHVYWCLSCDTPAEAWLAVAHALKAKCAALDFGADPAVTADAARILRCPGTLNRKEGTPLVCRVLADNGSTYTLDAIAQPLARSPLSGLTSHSDLKSGRDSYDKLTADEIAEMLGYINLPNIDGRDLWVTVLCAVQDWSEKSAEGFELFHDWSAGQPGYIDRADCFRTWDSFNPGGGIGTGTLVKLARDGGYTASEPKVDPVPAPCVPEYFSDAAAIAKIDAAAAPTISSVPLGAPPIPVGIVTSPLMIAAANAVRTTGEQRFKHNDAVHWLANEFVMVTDQDSVYYSITNKAALTKMVIDDLLTRYMPFNASGVPINASAIMRRYGTVHSVNSMGFFPGAPGIYLENGKSYVNQYLNPPDVIPGSPTEVRLIEDFWDYCFPTEEDQIFGNYLRQCYAHVVQRPSLKIASAPLMASLEHGNGKTTIMYDIPRTIIGPHSTSQVSNKVLRGTFSDFLNGKHFIHFDEIHINGRWDSDDTANSLKNIITGTTLEVHPKGLKSFNLPNRVFVSATSNYEDAISLPSNDERRWGVHYLRPTRAWASLAHKQRYFTVLHSWINSPRGPGVLRWYFSQVDLTGFNPQGAPPLTNAKRNMIRRSQTIETQLVMDAIDEGTPPFHGELFTFEQVKLFLTNETGKIYSTAGLTAALKKALPEAVTLRQVREGGWTGPKLPRAWAYKNLDKWQRATPEQIRDEIKTLSQH